jgi:hypothetical protein
MFSSPRNGLNSLGWMETINSRDLHQKLEIPPKMTLEIEIRTIRDASSGVSTCGDVVLQRCETRGYLKELLQETTGLSEQSKGGELFELELSPRYSKAQICLVLITVQQTTLN